MRLIKAQAQLPAKAPVTREQADVEHLALLILFVLFGALLLHLHRQLWKRIDDRIAAAVERIKAEVPPLLHLERQVALEMAEFRERLNDVEARTQNVQDQIDSERKRRI
jgi:hypothetical protein